MINFKREIAKRIASLTNIDVKLLEEYIEIPPDSNMGDYAFPCFKLAKELKKSPAIIADDLKEKIKPDELIEQIQVVGGYLNFYIHQNSLIKTVIEEFHKTKETYGKEKIGEGQTVLVEYSSPNIAKPFHIGHLRNTVIGSALYNMYKALGFHTISINHLGDYGTQFGKMIEGYKRWGEEYDLDHNPIEELTKIYVRINELCKKDDQVLNACRENFKKLEDGDEYCTTIWNKFKELSLKEFYRIYDLLGVQFDSLNGEAFYSDKMQEVENLLEKSGKLVKSEGAEIIDLEEKNMGVCMIKKSNGSTTYATRDLAAILYRARTYDFDKCLYIVAYEQNLHFKQVFEVAKLLGIEQKYIEGLQHVPYGMVHLKTGRMSTREGNIIKVNDLLEEAIERVQKIIEEKNPNMENKYENAKRIGIGAVIFNNLSTTIIKDQIFDWDEVLNFNGETGPYIQYTYVRAKSVLENAKFSPEKITNIATENLLDDKSIHLVKNIYEYPNALKTATIKNEPSILARHLLNLAKSYSGFYNENKIMVENDEIKNARLYLTYITKTVLEQGINLLGITMPDKM